MQAHPLRVLALLSLASVAGIAGELVFSGPAALASLAFALAPLAFAAFSRRLRR